MREVRADARDDRVATLQLLGGTILISFSAVFVRLVDVPPTSSAFYRVFVGAIVLGLMIAARRHSPAALARTYPLLILAALFFSADLFFWHRSIVLVGPGLATLLAGFQVFVLAVAGVAFYGERATLALWVSIPLALIGLALIVGIDVSGPSTDIRVGVIYGLLTALTYGAYLLSLRHARWKSAGHSPIVDLAAVSALSAVFLAGVAQVEGESLAIGSAADAGWLVMYGVVGQVLGWLLISSSLPRLPASRVGLVLLLQPMLSFVWDVLLFARVVTPREAVGAALALAAIYLGARARR